MPEGIIIKALSGFYYVKDGTREVRCRARGVFRKRGISPLVGDHVVYESAGSSAGYISTVHKRKNRLIRPPIANIDQAILVFSVAEPAFDSTLLDRFLVLMEAMSIAPIICFTKWDLLSEEEKLLFQKQYAYYGQIGYPHIRTSGVTEEGLSELKALMGQRISVVTGQSGVGKSTLLNHLNAAFHIETQAISQALGRGKHTTRHVELLPVPAGGYVADTPGFSALELPEMVAADLQYCFPEFAAFRDGCRFRGCTHLAEPGCMVKEAVSEHKISPIRYAHYQQFFHELSERERNKY